MVRALRFGTLGRDVLSKGYGLDVIDMRLRIVATPNNACDTRRPTRPRA